MNVLIVDDDPTTTLILKKLVNAIGFSVVEYYNPYDALKYISTCKESMIILSDWIMPEMDGIFFCEEVRKVQKKCNNEIYFYFILVTSKSEKEDLIKGLDSGADDYITKPIDPKVLNAKLNAAKRIVDLTVELIHTRKIYEELSMTDMLTGIFNRRAILSSLEAEMEKSKRGKLPLSIAIFDIDYFKKVNDVYGHEIGDEVLKGIVNIFAKNLRKYDILGRIGGEEFMVILPHSTPRMGYVVMQRCKNILEKSGINTSSGCLSVTVSCGVAGYNLGENMSDLMKRADSYLYKAKNSGRNLVVADF